VASGDVGTPGHVAGELFKIMTGVNLVHVPYRAEVGGVRPQTSDCGCLVFLIHASCDDPDRIIPQRSLQSLLLIPWRAFFGAGKSAVS
jgi:hypothetical protein